MKRRTKSTLVLVLGLVVLLPGAGVLALLMGARELVRQGRSTDRVRVAVGMLSGSLATLVWVWVVVSAWPFLTMARGDAGLAIYEVDLASGTRQVLVDREGLEDYCPAYLPNGGGVVFEGQDEAGGMRLWRADAAGRVDPAPVVEGPGSQYRPAPSPDGTRIAFLQQWPDGVALGVASFSDGSVRFLTAKAQRMSAPRWSEDGERILVSARFDDQPARMFVVSSGGGEPRRLVLADDAAGDVDDDPDWAPPRIVFARMRELMTVSLDGGLEPKPLYRCSPPGIARIHGDRVFFTSDEVGVDRGIPKAPPSKIFEGDVSGKKPRLVFDAGRMVRCFDVSADGRRLLVALQRR